MVTKQEIAQMQIEAEVSAFMAKLTTLSQYVDSRTPYGKALEELKKNLSVSAVKLTNAKE